MSNDCALHIRSHSPHLTHYSLLTSHHSSFILPSIHQLISTSANQLILLPPFLFLLFFPLSFLRVFVAIISPRHLRNLRAHSHEHRSTINHHLSTAPPFLCASPCSLCLRGSNPRPRRLRVKPYRAERASCLKRVARLPRCPPL